MVNPQEFEYRRSVLRVLLVITIISVNFFAIINFMGELKAFALMEAAVGMFWCWIFYSIKKTNHLQRWTFVYLCSFYVLVVYGISIAPFKNALFAWLFIFPILSYLLLGIKAGTVLTVVSVFFGLGSLVWRIYWVETDLNWIVMGNVGLCIASIWAMAFVYEYKREEVVTILQEQVTKDPLTGLLNMRTLNDILNYMLRSAERRTEPLTIAYIDLNNFKEINDTQGHQKGNEILITVANTIKRITRAEDHAFRYGGDEFCIIFANCTLEQAKNGYGKRLAEETHAKLDKFTMSIGYAQTGPDQYILPNELINQADKNMYETKKESKRENT